MSTTAQSSTGHKPDNIVGRIIKVIVPLAVSAGMIGWLLHKVDFHQVEAIISRGVDYRYIVAMMCLTVLSMVIRGFRWGIQLRAAGIPRIPAVAECSSIFGAYALNLVFTFLGEAWRCLYISRRERCKLSTVVGTDLGDRASDAVMIGLLIVVAVFTARPYLLRFLDRYPLGQTIDHITTGGALYIWLAVIAAVILLAELLFRSSPAIQGFNASVRRIWDGFRVIFHMKGTGLYIVLTFGIWICYFLETYVCFFAFPFTRELISGSGYAAGLVPGLVVFVFGSCSMGIPSSGGLGPWNIAVMFALSLFGISDADGTAYSILCWSFQALAFVIAGVFAFIYIARSRAVRRV